MGIGKPSYRTPHLSPAVRETLRSWGRSPKTAQRLAFRSRIVLAAADGASVAEIARRLATTRPTVRNCLRRFAEVGSLGLAVDRPGRGRPRSLGEGVRAEIAALHSLTGEATAIDVAERFGTSVSTVRRIWRSEANKEKASSE